MLSPAFHVVASILAKNQVAREMDVAELGVVGGGGVGGIDGTTRGTTETTIPSHVAATLRRYSAEVPNASSSSTLMSTREAIRRAEELTLIADTLQAAVQSAMTIKLNPTSMYLLSFSSTKEISDESIACAMNLSPEDLRAVGELLMARGAENGGGSSSGPPSLNTSLSAGGPRRASSSSSGLLGGGGGSSSRTSNNTVGGGSSAMDGSALGLFPAQFLDPSAPHNNVFSLISNRRRQQAAHKQAVAAAAAAAEAVGASSSASSASPAVPPAPQPLPRILDTFTDVLGALLIDELGSDDDEDDDGVGTSSRRKKIKGKVDRLEVREGDGDEDDGTDSAANNAGAAGGGGMRALTESYRRRWASLFLIWSRWSTAMALGANAAANSASTTSTATPPSHVNIVDVLLKHFTGSVYPSFDWVLVGGGRGGGSSNPPTPPPPAEAGVRGNPGGAGMSPFEQKWGKSANVSAATLRKVVLIQSLIRRLWAKRVLLPRRIAAVVGTTGRGSNPHQRGKYSHTARHENLFGALFKAYNAQQPTLLTYLNTTTQLMADEAKAEDFYETEEAVFNKQFKQWSAKMTRYYLEECPLDVDWVVQKEPINDPNFQPSSDAELRAMYVSSPQGDVPWYLGPASGITPQQQHERQQSFRAANYPRYLRMFVNTKTGKSQLENPNMLKAIATKNRQQAKAQKDREMRVLEMNRFVETQINAVKREVLPRLEEQLSAPVYI